MMARSFWKTDTFFCIFLFLAVVPSDHGLTDPRDGKVPFSQFLAGICLCCLFPFVSGMIVSLCNNLVKF